MESFRRENVPALNQSAAASHLPPAEQLMATNRQRPPMMHDSSPRCPSTSIGLDAVPPSTSSAYSKERGKRISEVSNAPAAKRPRGDQPSVMEETARFVRESTENLGQVLANAFIESLKQSTINALPHMEQAAESVYISIQQLGGDPSTLKKRLDPIFKLSHQFWETRRICSLDFLRTVVCLKDQIKALRPNVVASLTQIESQEKELMRKKAWALKIEARIDGLRRELMALEENKKSLVADISDVETSLNERMTQFTDSTMVKRALEVTPLQVKDILDPQFRSLAYDLTAILASKNRFLSSMVQNIPEL